MNDRIRKISVFFLSTASAVLFGYLAAHPAINGRAYLEVLSLWVLPVVALGLLLRTQSSVLARCFLIIFLVLAIGIAEYIGIQLRPIGNMPLTIPADRLYSYATIYLLIGPIHFFLFSCILLVEAKRMKKTLAILVAILLVIASWFFVSFFSDYRPFIISSSLLWIVLETILFVGALSFVLRRWMVWSRGFLLSILALASAFLPYYFA